LTISFEGDNFAPQKAVRILCEKFNEDAPVQQVHLTKDDDRNDRFNHFNWSKKPANILKIIEEWSR